jgi:hypothetical protein
MSLERVQGSHGKSAPASASGLKIDAAALERSSVSMEVQWHEAVET